MHGQPVGQMLIPFLSLCDHPIRHNLTEAAVFSAYPLSSPVTLVHPPQEQIIRAFHQFTMFYRKKLDHLTIYLLPRKEEDPIFDPTPVKKFKVRGGAVEL